ncbi:hypothetical protein SD81_030910 [Tolypothrix campylonemoides VB511288]|nr:hypothetical protein SD81_030910 [Tolypothrix campylonemoides VB511288]
MKAQIVEQVEFFSQAELQSLEFVPEELEAIEAERVPDLDSISFEEVAKELEAYFEGGVQGARLERRGGLRGRRGHKTKGTCYTGRDCDGRRIGGSFQHCHNCKAAGGKSILRNSGACEKC